jgi:excinuclease ABC subunit C
MPFDPTTLEQFPPQPGVYIMKDARGRVLYVGKAKQLKTRVKQYFLEKRDSREMIPFLIQEVESIDTLVVPSEKEALLLENTLIKRHQPKFNAVLKDDKTFISLMINHKHPWPLIRLVRCHTSRKDDNLYFGPYTSGYAAKKTYELLNRLFPLRQCSDAELGSRTRPCILYEMKRCIAPCVAKCTSQDYHSLVTGAIEFLKGHNKEVTEGLKEEINRAANALEFERAAQLLETLTQIEHVIGAKTLVAKIDGVNCDALAIYREGTQALLVRLLFREGKLVDSEHFSFTNALQEDESLLTSFILQHYEGRIDVPDLILTPLPLEDARLLEEIMACSILAPQRGEKKALLDIATDNAQALFRKEKDEKQLQEMRLFELQTILRLNRYPKHIVCFDTSHIQGSDTVAAAITFIDGVKQGKAKRLFKIGSTRAGDDYGALREVLKRHLSKVKESLPDLVIVDGGKGQLQVALEVFKELGLASVDLIAVTKEAGRHDKGMTAERIFLPGQPDPIHLSSTSSLLFLLQRIRDEAHKQALQFHQKQRTRRYLTSALDTIPGIGPLKRRRLLEAFGSVENIKAASDEALKQIKGITARDIRALRDC